MSDLVECVLHVSRFEPKPEMLQQILQWQPNSPISEEMNLFAALFPSTDHRQCKGNN